MSRKSQYGGNVARKQRRFMLKMALIMGVVLAVLLFVISLYAFPRVRLALGIRDLPGTYDDLRSQQVFGYKTSEIQSALLGECRRESKYVCMEQDVDVTLELTQMTWNIPLLKKYQTMQVFGTGAFGVDLSKMKEDFIDVDNHLRYVDVRIPRAELLYIVPDYESASFSDVKHAVLPFGDIKLTPEEQNAVNLQIEEAMRTRLDSVFLLEKADGLAQSGIKDLFQSLVEKGYVVRVQFAE